MGSCNRACGINVCFLGLFLGVLAGVIVGVLFFLALLPTIVFGVLVALVLAILALILLYVGAYIAETNPTAVLSRCLCRHTACLLAGIFGTILSSAIALSTLLIPFSIAAAVIVAVVVFFFVLLVVELIAYLTCFACRASRCSD